jgi:LuxR family maltose regulon positive regulatory protein
MTTPLLHTKLMPPRLHTSVILRPELMSRLDGGLNKKLTLVSAPTGFGKTTLVRSWLSQRDLRQPGFADENDNDPVRF